jgi:predicted RNase H-like HicB family nuclease
MQYLAYLRKDEGSDFGVEFPDLPGCVTAGRTLAEAQAMAAEALAGHLSVLDAESMVVPKPSTLDDLRDDPHREDAVVILVEAPDDLLRSERVNVMIPRHLLARIDAVSGGNRSRYVVEAVVARLDR